MNKIILIALVSLATLLTGCATPLGQQYGTVGAIGGAIIGGAAGGGRGALIGGATGALLGGAVGDQQTYQNGQPRLQPQYPQYRQDNGYDAPPVQPQCWIQRNAPLYDRYGNFYGYGDKRVCRR